MACQSSTWVWVLPFASYDILAYSLSGSTLLRPLARPPIRPPWATTTMTVGVRRRSDRALESRSQLQRSMRIHCASCLFHFLCNVSLSDYCIASMGVQDGLCRDFQQFRSHTPCARHLWTNHNNSTDVKRQKQTRLSSNSFGQIMDKWTTLRRRRTTIIHRSWPTAHLSNLEVVLGLVVVSWCLNLPVQSGENERLYILWLPKELGLYLAGICEQNQTFETVLSTLCARYWSWWKCTEELRLASYS